MAKAKRDINTSKLVDHLDEMINTLEYDAQRSAGKCKQAAPDLYYLWALRDRYTVPAKKPAAKPTTKKVTEE